MQITSYENLTSDKIMFHEDKEYKVKNSKLKYQRIKIETKFPNGQKRSSCNRDSIFGFLWSHRTIKSRD